MLDMDEKLGPSAHGIRKFDYEPKMDIRLPLSLDGPKEIREIIELLKSIDKTVKEINAKLK